VEAEADARVLSEKSDAKENDFMPMYERWMGARGRWGYVQGEWPDYK
jgi:hypothetical protein